MTAFEVWTLVLAGVALIVNGSAIYFGLRQIRLLGQQLADSQRATTLDHARRKAQSTIDFYSGTLGTRSEFRARLPFDRDTDAVADVVLRARKDADLTKLLADYLGMWELFATAANTDVTDRDVVNLIAGGRIRAIVDNYGSWIAWRRDVFGADSLYCELVALADSLPPLDESRRHIGYAMTIP